MEEIDPQEADGADLRWAWLLLAAAGVAVWVGGRMRAAGKLQWLGLPPPAAPDDETSELLAEARREQQRRSVVDKRQEEVAVTARLRRRQRLQHRRKTLLREAEEAEKKYVGAGTYLDRDPIQQRSEAREAPSSGAALLAEQDAEYEASMMADLRRDWEREEERRVAAAAADAEAETSVGDRGGDVARERPAVTLPQPPAPRAGEEVVTCVILVPGGRRTRFQAPASSRAACLAGAIVRLLGRASGAEAAPGTQPDARAWVASVGVPARTILRGPRTAAVAVTLAAEGDGPEAGRDTWQALSASGLDAPIGDLGVNGAAVRVAFTDDGC